MQDSAGEDTGGTISGKHSSLRSYGLPFGTAKCPRRVAECLLTPNWKLPITRWGAISMRRRLQQMKPFTRPDLSVGSGSRNVIEPPMGIGFPEASKSIETKSILETEM